MRVRGIAGIEMPLRAHASNGTFLLRADLISGVISKLTALRLPSGPRIRGICLPRIRGVGCHWGIFGVFPL